MKISARNILKGRFKQVNPDAVNTEVVLELSGGETITAIITRQSAENLGLEEGKEAYAVIKASSVILAVD